MTNKLDSKQAYKILDVANEAYEIQKNAGTEEAEKIYLATWEMLPEPMVS